MDPRLLHYARSTRLFLVLSVVLGVAIAILVITQAWLLARIIVGVSEAKLDVASVTPLVALLAGVFAVRALLASTMEATALRTSARAKQDLRQATLRSALAAGPAGPASVNPAELTTIITRGIDALDSYYARYLPQLVLAVVIPLTVLGVVLGQDPLAAVILAATIPLVPIFMILIGMFTKAKVNRQWQTLAVLSGHFLDLIQGLPTLKLFGRAQAQARMIHAVSSRYRTSTMGVLRITFLSSLALELLAALSVALVAVSVGLRLAQGDLTFAVALFVLLLAPEVYLPLRQVGQHFHAAAEGLGAAERVFEILDEDRTGSGVQVLTETVTEIHCDQVILRRRGHVTAPVTFTARAGTITAITGPSGCGKSTLIAALLGAVAPDSGQLTANGVSLGHLNQQDWRKHLGWVGQRPQLMSTDLDASCTVAEAVRLGRPTADEPEVWAALEFAGVAEEVAGLPAGLGTLVTIEHTGLSVGQLQRVALARALIRQPDVLLLDEPSAGLDSVSEAAVLRALRKQAERGAVVVIVSHRPALLAGADHVVQMAAQGSAVARASVPA